MGQWLAEEGISAGFPSPADDFLDVSIDLNKVLIKNKDATFYGRVKGDSMIEAHIDEGDMVIAERSQTAKDGDIVIFPSSLPHRTLPFSVDRNRCVIAFDLMPVKR